MCAYDQAQSYRGARESVTCPPLLTEREIEPFPAARFISVLNQLLWFFFFLTVSFASFHANSRLGNIHPVGQVSFVRLLACLLTDSWCNFCCCLPLPSLKFSFWMYLLITIHYFISNFVYLSHSWKSALCTTVCSLGSSLMKKFLCPLAYSIYLPCSSPLEICSFLCGKW